MGVFMSIYTIIREGITISISINHKQFWCVTGLVWFTWTKTTRELYFYCGILLCNDVMYISCQRLTCCQGM